MSNKPSPEHRPGPSDRLTAAAVFAGALALGAALFRHIFGPLNKDKHR